MEKLTFSRLLGEARIAKKSLSQRWLRRIYLNGVKVGAKYYYVEQG